MNRLEETITNGPIVPQQIEVSKPLLHFSTVHYERLISLSTTSDLTVLTRAITSGVVWELLAGACRTDVNPSPPLFCVKPVSIFEAGFVYW
jgi:hypothetical protein